MGFINAFASQLCVFGVVLFCGVQVFYKTSALKFLCNAALAILVPADLPTHPMSNPIISPASVPASFPARAQVFKQVFIQGMTKDGKVFRPSACAV
jgi:hypothetical protein